MTQETPWKGRVARRGRGDEPWRESMGERGLAHHPAHAGMNPASKTGRTAPARRPRTRGEEPWTEFDGLVDQKLPPHARGQTRGTRTRGDEPDRRAQGGSYPALAGIDRAGELGGAGRWRLPRARGDPPSLAARRRSAETPDPAVAGMDRGCTPASTRTPGARTRGDAPRLGEIVKAAV